MAGLGDGLTGIVILLVLLAAGMPVGFTMTVVGFFGIAAIYDWNWTAAVGTLGLVPFAKASSYLFVTIPLFILMGQFTYRAGISKELFAAARQWWGHWPGGLAVATVGTAAGFAAASGSSLAKRAVDCAKSAKSTVTSLRCSWPASARRVFSRSSMERRAASAVSSPS